jgi:hypothetical protein
MLLRGVRSRLVEHVDPGEVVGDGVVVERAKRDLGEVVKGFGLPGGGPAQADPGADGVGPAGEAPEHGRGLLERRGFSERLAVHIHQRVRPEYERPGMAGGDRRRLEPGIVFGQRRRGQGGVMRLLDLVGGGHDEVRHQLPQKLTAAGRGRSQDQGNGQTHAGMGGAVRRDVNDLCREVSLVAPPGVRNPNPESSRRGAKSVCTRPKSGYFERFVKAPRILFALLCALLWCASPTPLQAQRMVKVPLADGFEIPVGKPPGEGYYVFRGYAPNGHLGEDWNGKGGGDSDLGDPVYSCADGIVVFSFDVRVGWGNCVIVRHAYRDPDGSVHQVDSLYAHLDRRTVRKDQIVRRGQQVGTIGTAHGRYAAHLHFEMRKNLEVGMNRSKFARDFSVYYSPRQFMATRGTLKGGSMTSIAVDTFGPYAGSGASPEKSDDAGGSDGPVREIPTRESAAAARPNDLKKKLDQLDELVDKNKKNVEALTDEDVDGFWDRLKTRLKNGKGTSSGEAERP